MVLLWKSIYTQSTSKLTGGQYYDQTYTADGLEFLEHLRRKYQTAVLCRIRKNFRMV